MTAFPMPTTNVLVHPKEFKSIPAGAPWIQMETAYRITGINARERPKRIQGPIQNGLNQRLKRRKLGTEPQQEGNMGNKEGLCKGDFFSIAGNDPPDVVIQLIKSELQKSRIDLSEPKANTFYFSTTAENWRMAGAKLQEALEDRDMIMVEGAPQILELAVTEVRFFWDFHDVGCTMNLNVQTLQDQVRNFTATNIAPELYVACDWAMSKAGIVHVRGPCGH